MSVSFPPKRRSSAPVVPAAPAGAKDARIELRLSIGKDGLGIELAAPVTLACLRVTELSLSMPGARFPLDVSGGVSRFRHRRGELQRLTLEVRAEEFSRWAAPRLRGVIGVGASRVWVGLATGAPSATIAIADEEGGAILAFDLSVSAGAAPDPRDAPEDTARLFITGARGIGLPAPATALAIEAMTAILGRSATRLGASFIVPRASSRLANALLPDAGARAPSTDLVRWTAMTGAEDGWVLQAARAAVPAEESREAALAREANTLTRGADDALHERSYDRARALAVALLERAPRHPEVCGRIAEIDRHVGGRSEAALATLADEERGAHHMILRAELLAEIGDASAAIAAFVEAAEAETVPALAARAFERAAELAPNAEDALDWLDRAIARAPAIAHLRWSRLARRLALGRIEDATADAEHLEAQARGSRARHEVWSRAGAAWRRAGLATEAGHLFERALRFVPDDAVALAGLGRSLLAQGRTARGVALLTRAVEVAERAGERADDALVDLARALAETFDDRPAAIARIREVADGGAVGVEARALEGRWRAALGDLAGASLAYARLRERVASLGVPLDAPLARASVLFLTEAAAFERKERRDLLGAQRHLAAALRVAPHDAELGASYREVGALLAGVPEDAPRAPPAGALDAADDEARVEELTRMHQGNPSDAAVVDELAARLLRLGRTYEVFALLSAQLEDASPARRAELVPTQRAALDRLILDARERDQELEARLYADARARLDR